MRSVIPPLPDRCLTCGGKCMIERQILTMPSAGDYVRALDLGEPEPCMAVEMVPDACPDCALRAEIEYQVKTLRPLP